MYLSISGCKYMNYFPMLTDIFLSSTIQFLVKIRFCTTAGEKGDPQSRSSGKN